MTSQRFDAVNLSLLPPPPVIEPLDYPTLKAAYIAALKAELLVSFGLVWNMDEVEADPGSALAETTGYRELIMRGRVNDAARAVMLASATGGDLDALAAWYSVVRFVGESDDAFRERVQLAPEALSVAGSKGAYVFQVRRVSPLIIDVGVYSPAPGKVTVIPLVAAGDGRPDAAMLDLIRIALLPEDVRPLTDNVSVRPPRPVQVTVQATLLISEGPDPVVVRVAADRAQAAYCASRRKVGMPLYRSGVIAALAVGGVDDVILSSPIDDVICEVDQVIFEQPATITVVGPTP